MKELLDDDLLALLLAEAEDDLQPPAQQPRLDQAPLSFAQQRLWLEQQRAPHSSAYNLPRALRLSGALDAAALEAALGRVIDRHDILRTAFIEYEGEIQQVVERQARLILHREDLTALEPAARDAALAQHLQEQAARAFDLTQAPLIRATLLKRAAEEHVLLLNMHHIVSDAWSNGILMQDLLRAYTQACLDDRSPLPPLAMQYTDYAQWQRGEYLDSAACARSGDYWREYLGSELPVLELPQDTPRTAGQQHVAEQYQCSLAPPLVDAFNTFCQRQGLTPFVLALAAWQLLLGRYSNQNDFTVGVPNANRNRGETQALVGFFVSSQVYRVRLDPSQRLLDFLHDLRRQSLAAMDHADYPLELLLDQLQRAGSPSGNPLFQVLFNWRTGGAEAPPMALNGLTLDFLEAGDSQAKFDLSLDIDYSARGLTGTFEFSRDLYHPATIERMAGHWQNLLHSIIQSPQRTLGELPLLSPAEQQQILAEWNRQPTVLPRQHCLHQLIEAQVNRAGEAIALSFGDQRMSYAELNRQANCLAHQLIDAGVGPEVLVGIAVERTPQMIVGLLAILKAGGAYVPLDPAYPPDRLAYMIEDSGVALVLTQAHLREQLALAPQVRCLLLEQTSAGNEHNPDVAVHPDNLAYVIYTSGSTGKPKGALLPHHNVVRLFEATADWFDFNHTDVWCLFHSYAFDFSVWELFGALLHGGRLVIVPHAISRSPQDMYALLCAEKVSVLNQTPSAFKQLMLAACEPEHALTQHLRYVIFGGEAIDVHNLRPWFERFGERSPQLINMYGITETTVHVSYRPLSLADLDSAAASPLGVPIVDLSWYVLDPHLNPVAKGCVGELYVGGAGLARGYHKRSDLTAARFIPDPFDPMPGGRLYRTGDLARYGADGSIEYAGRIDHQVKIRGFRIELGEIQMRLQAQPAVHDCVVLTHDGPSGQQLVGYVIAREPASGELRDHLLSALRSQLPDYMVPAHLLFIEHFPLNANGKLDRKQLPPPDASLWQQTYVAPTTSLEQGLAELWEQTLGIDRVGTRDNFFELGGHSILAIQFISTLKARLNIDLRLQELLAHPSIGELARFISRKHREQSQCVVKMNTAPAGAPTLFCVHPSGGIVFCYQPLAKKLHGQASVYGVMHRGFSEQQNDRQTWNEMIADYSREIIKAQPQGPYHLLGWSLGGPIALDIAATLEGLGHQVAFLGLVDSTVPEQLYPADLPRHRHLRGEQTSSDASEELREAVDYFDLLFPTLTERTAAWLRDSPHGSVKQFYDWAAGLVEPGQGDLLTIVQSIKTEVMNAQAFSVHERLVEAFDAFTFKPVSVAPSCWWAVPEKTAQELAFAEELITRFSRSGALNCSVYSPELHRSMIFDEGLIGEVVEVFLGADR